MSSPKHAKKITLTHSLIFRIVLAIIGIVSVAVVVAGIPILINEMYKCNSGYETVWDAADVLTYYGSILSGIITIATVIVTIRFTSKQIKRERYLAKNIAKLDKIDEIISQALIDISPMKILEEPALENNGLENIRLWRNLLIEYKISINLSLTMLESYINPRESKELSTYIDRFNKVADFFDDLAQNLYQELTKSDDDINENVFDLNALIDFDKIHNITNKIFDAYHGPYRDLIAAKRELFDELYKKIDRQADDIISWNIKSKI